MRDLIERIERLWCENMHTGVSWPIHGRYRCNTCFREYEVAFDHSAEALRRAGAAVPELRVSASARLSVS